MISEVSGEGVVLNAPFDVDLKPLVEIRDRIIEIVPRSGDVEKNNSIFK